MNAMNETPGPHLRRWSVTSLMSSASALALVLGLALAGAPGPSAAADPMPSRDPMAPPPAGRPAAPAEPSAAAPAPVARHLMVVDGRRYVIEGGRRRGMGDPLGNARIERIDDNAVWVRQDGALQRLSLYGDVVRRAVPAPDTPLARPVPPPRPTLPTATALARPQPPTFLRPTGDPQ